MIREQINAEIRSLQEQRKLIDQQITALENAREALGRRLLSQPASGKTPRTVSTHASPAGRAGAGYVNPKHVVSDEEIELVSACLASSNEPTARTKIAEETGLDSSKVGAILGTMVKRGKVKQSDYPKQKNTHWELTEGELIRLHVGHGEVA